MTPSASVDSNYFYIKFIYLAGTFIQRDSWVKPNPIQAQSRAVES